MRGNRPLSYRPWMTSSCGEHDALTGSLSWQQQFRSRTIAGSRTELKLDGDHISMRIHHVQTIGHFKANTRSIKGFCSMAVLQAARPPSA